MQLLGLLVLAPVLSLGSVKSIAILSKSLWGVILLSFLLPTYTMPSIWKG